LSESDGIQVFENNDTDEPPVSECFLDVGKFENTLFQDNRLHPFFDLLHMVCGEKTAIIEPNENLLMTEVNEKPDDLFLVVFFVMKLPYDIRTERSKTRLPGIITDIVKWLSS